ncbi:MAG: hypothetical protein JST51_07810 [Armatimonadetes bacterium]|nr:hypothetical protein [Armatimonadota bacterium]
MSLQRASIQVSLGSIFVYLVSFFNQLLIARAFGAGARMDAYLAGANVPLTINNLIGAVFVYAVVPHIVHEAVHDESLKPKMMGLLVGCLGLSLVTLTVGLTAHVWPLTHTSQFGTYRPEAVWAATLSWCSCAVFFITALSDALFNANRSFVFPVLAYLPAYLLTPCSVFFLGQRLGGPAIAGATLIGYLLVIPLRIFRQREYLVRQFDFSMFRAFLKRIPFTALAVMSLYSFPVIDAYLGPKAGEGVLSILGYSTRIISTLAVIVALGPFGVLIPELATHSAEANRERFSVRAQTLFRYALTLLVPVALWIFIFRLPVITLLLQRGQFGPDDSQHLAGLLMFNIPGSIFMVLSMLMVRVFLADKRMIEAAGLSTLNFVMYLTFCSVLTPKYGLNGFGMSFVSAWTLHAILAITVLFAKDHGHIEWSKVGRFVGRLAATTGILVLLGFAIRTAVPMQSKLTSLIVLPLSLAVCLLAFFGVGHLMGSPEHQRVWGMLARFSRRSRSA